MSRKSIKTIASLITFTLLFSFSSYDRAFATAGLGIPNINTGLKKKPGGSVAANTRYNISAKGDLNLGQLEEGSYALTFSRKEPPPGTCITCKSFYDTRSNTARATVVIDGVKDGPISFIFDLDRNIMLNTKTLMWEPLGEISFDVEGDTVVTGKVAFVKLVPTTQTSSTQ